MQYSCNTFSNHHQTMLVVLAEKLAQIIEWLKSAAGYRKFNSNQSINIFKNKNSDSIAINS